MRTTDGEIVASIDTPVAGTLSFSGDGKRLVAVSNGSMQSFDLATGKPSLRVGLPAGLNARNGAPLGDTHVWLDGIVFDLNANAPVASYAVDGPWKVVGTQLVALIKTGADAGRNKNRALCAWTLPQPNTPAPAKATLIELGKGTRVALDLQLEGDAALQEQATQALARTLGERGATIEPGAALRICSRVETGKTESRTYETVSGAPWDRQRETVNVTSKITRLFIEQDGKPIWEVSSTNSAGFMLSRKQGQSMQDAANDASRANVGIIEQTPLPDVVPVFDVKALPQFKLVPGGVQKK